MNGKATDGKETLPLEALLSFEHILHKTGGSKSLIKVTLQLKKKSEDRNMHNTSPRMEIPRRNRPSVRPSLLILTHRGDIYLQAEKLPPWPTPPPLLYISQPLPLLFLPTTLLSRPSQPESRTEHPKLQDVFHPFHRSSCCCNDCISTVLSRCLR